MTRPAALPFPLDGCASGTISLPRTLSARLRKDADTRDVAIKRSLFDAVKSQIGAVELESRVRGAKRAKAYEYGAESVAFSLPLPLHRRCMAVVCTTHDGEGRSTGALSYVLRRCIALHYPDAVPVGGAPIPTKEPPVASIIVLLPVPPALHMWLRQQPSDLSKQVRGAIDAHLPAVAANQKVSRATSPYRGKGQMKPVPLRVPLGMHAALKQAALDRGVSMSAIARICIALHVQQTVQAGRSTHA